MYQHSVRVFPQLDRFFSVMKTNFMKTIINVDPFATKVDTSRIPVYVALINWDKDVVPFFQTLSLLFSNQ